jgi:hypothetical protein
MQHYVVERITLLEDSRLRWHRNNQRLIMGTHHQHQESCTNRDDKDYHYSDSDEEDTEHGGNDDDAIDTQDKERKEVSKSFLSGSFTGGPRHLRMLAHNALTVVTELGTPTAFITATTNPKWPEILERLLPGQTAYDRPDITCQVRCALWCSIYSNRLPSSQHIF